MKGKEEDSFSLYGLIKDILFRKEKKKKGLTKEQVERLYGEISRVIPLEAYEKEMLHGVLVLKNIVVKEVMVPRTDVVAVEENEELDNIVRVIIEKGFSRMPVYKERIDEVVGVVYAKDLFRYWWDRKGVKAKNIMREPFFVPESKRIVDLLKEFKEKKVHIAIVVDEYGGVSGIVTMEDLLEEIVGDIRDEYDRGDEERIKRMEDGSYLVDPKIDLDVFSEFFGLDLYDETCETLGGYLITRFGEVPKVGSELDLGRVKIVVEKVSPKKIEAVRVYVEKDTHS